VKRQRLIILNWALGILSIALGIYLLLPREPLYGGKRLSVWLEEFTPSLKRGIPMEARDAIRHMGTNALPSLVREMKVLDAPFGSRILTWINSKQSKLAFTIKSPARRRANAAIACETLGPAATPVVPELIGLLDDETAGVDAALALVAIGEPAISPLLENLPQASGPARSLSADILAQGFPSATESIVARLVQRLQHPKPEVRVSAIEPLCKYQLQSPAAIPAVVACLADVNAEVRYVAALNLSRCVGDEPRKAAVAVLLNALKDPEQAKKIDAADHLKLIDSKVAKAAGL
jgi:hypothetical protein